MKPATFREYVELEVSLSPATKEFLAELFDTAKGYVFFKAYVIKLCYVVLYCIVLYNITLYYYIMLYYITLYDYIMLYYIILY
jgi:hypothetical protein